MAEWWSIEVLHGEFSAFRWQEQHDSALIEAALTNGAVDGAWHADRWGVVFEICFDSEERWETFRNLPAVRAALDGVPDPVNGLLIYRGRGGGAGDRKPRQPRPAPSASAVSMPEPYPVPHLDLTGIWPPDLVYAGGQEGQDPDPPGMAWGPDLDILAVAGERGRGYFSSRRRPPATSHAITRTAAMRERQLQARPPGRDYHFVA